MKNKIEIDIGKVDFKVLWKIKEINLDTITFVKYDIGRGMSLEEGKESILLEDVIGTETHKCQSNVILQIGGEVGKIIKGFKLEKTGKTTIKVTNIIKLE